MLTYPWIKQNSDNPIESEVLNENNLKYWFSCMFTVNSICLCSSRPESTDLYNCSYEKINKFQISISA